VSDLSTSNTLLGRARARDSRAWDRLVELYGPLILHWIRAKGLRDADAADCVQEVFRAAVGGIDRFRKDRPADSFRAWLRTIAQSKITDHYRARGRDPQFGLDSELGNRPAPELESNSAIPPEDGEATERALQNELLRRALEEVRSSVHERTYQAFVRTVLDGRAPCDVAEELDMQTGTVRVAKSRVLQRLRTVLGDID
jgi:RNA polymerase sigma-70 factor, ECF subfamily